MRFTDRSIAALKPKAERYEVWEDGRTGLGVRVSPKSRKSWIYMYRFAGKARRMGLGTYPLVSLASAGVKHARAKELLAEDIDPGARQVERKRAERTAETVADLIDEYLEKWARPRKRSANEDERILRKDVLPVWGKRKAKDIRRRDVIELLDEIVDRGAPIQANRTLAVIRKMFNFAIGRGILDTTPVAMVKAPSKENQRDRFLSADEIRIFWKGLDKAPMSDGIKLALNLQLVTAQRKGEIIGAALSEFDLDEAVWTIPAERSKNGQAHRVPLSSLALELIEEARELARKKAHDTTDEDIHDATAEPEWLFPSPRGEGPISAPAINHALYRVLRSDPHGRPEPAIKLENMTPHDLRRTAASGMTALGTSRLTVSKILNHTETGVTAVYDRHSYDAEKRRALDAWGARLMEIVEGKPAAQNVVPLVAGNEPA
jgi:integrase